MKTEFSFDTKNGTLEVGMDFTESTIDLQHTSWEYGNSDIYKIELHSEIDNLKNFKQMLGLMIDKYEDR